ncbi:cytochrome b/b6 domain-containing protein [Candidatus Halobeggiatoa sp. HSG11]|nr:cytochrome b/b6 domain-containing protein [Candidatus Halobeggiatoa sp. HSG11]
MNKYHGFLRTIHWLMFVLFAIIFVLGVVMIEFKECCEPWGMYSFHKSTGVLVFLLVLLRIVARKKTTIPPHPEYVTPIQHNIAQSVVYLLYLFMVLVPISGYALSNVYGHHVSFYGLQLPMLFSENPEWEGITSALHYYLTYSFLGIFLLHIMGVIKHHVDNKDILSRIT